MKNNVDIKVKMMYNKLKIKERKRIKWQRRHRKWEKQLA